MFGRVLIAGLLLSTAACDVAERTDFLIGRTCRPEAPADCDEGQRCLPHGVEGESYYDFRCRDAASFEKFEGREPPLAYCSETEGYVCPPGLACKAERIRETTDPVYVRRLVCQDPDSPFGPPL